MDGDAGLEGWRWIFIIVSRNPHADACLLLLLTAARRELPLVSVVLLPISC